MKTIVALVDFSDVTAKVVNHALELALACGGEIFLVHVVAPMPGVVDDAAALVPYDNENTEARRAQLQALQLSIKERHAEVSIRLFEGLVMETLLAHLPELNPDVVVMGSHGHGALYHLIVGSVTQGVVKHAVWPVLIIPAIAALGKETEKLSEPQKADATHTPLITGSPGGALMPA